MPLLEIACFNVESALIAQASGADRIELCKDQHLGGTTPLLSDFRELKNHVEIPVNVMIRPRGGGFVYNSEELHQMEVELGMFRGAGADGFVFGILEDWKVDVKRCRHLLEKAQGKPCTFHRAFDEIAEQDMSDQMEVLIDCGFKSILTSGGKKSALEGSKVLRKLVEDARGRIDVIAGGGVRSGNIQALKQVTVTETFHSSAIIAGGELASKEEVEALKNVIKP
ncbi:hypothetical protein EG329_007881 [Mollisiaceae sp. DMI_Dod_QoI]|nr:hypothetical protein EG329_007881 [Helotiales sp. DMI_Dod_QoI]